MLLTFRWSNVQGEDEEHIVQANMIEILQNKLIRNFLPKKELEDCLMIGVSNYKKKKIQ